MRDDEIKGILEDNKKVLEKIRKLRKQLKEGLPCL